MRANLAMFTLAVCVAAPPAPRKEVIHIPVWAQAEAGTPAPKLDREGMKVTVDGKAVQPAGVLGPDDDLVVLMVADLAGDVTLAETAKAALNERMEGLSANTMVGLLRAQDGLRVLVDATADRAPVKAAIQSLPVSGKAGLLDSLTATGTLGDAILAKAGVRLAVLYVTDSDVSNYREDFTNPTINYSDSGDISRRFRDGLVRERISKLDAALATVESPLFIVHLAYRTDTLNQAYQTGLMTLAATTGGASYFCRSQAEISETIGRVFETIRSHYSVKVPLPASNSEAVDVEVASSGQTLNWRKRFALGR